MATADWALVISICSAFLSLGSLIWGIWSKFIFPKPYLIVTFSVIDVVDQRALRGSFLNLSVTNHGPIPDIVTVSLIKVRRSAFRSSLGIIQPLTNYLVDPEQTLGPSTGLPKKLEIGEEFSLKYWYGKPSFLADPIFRVGVRDTFGGCHWCRRRDVRLAKKQFAEDDKAGKLPLASAEQR